MTRASADAVEQVVLVDAHDVALGVAGKLDVHRTGQLHRAVSVFICDDAGRILLQQRAAGKYHSPGRWSNTCCGHPRLDETPIGAAARRLQEEMGLLCALSSAGSFQYRADLGDGLVEHELDHVFVGRSTARPHPDPLEVDAWRWEDIPSLEADVARRPEAYTHWLSLALAVAARHPLLSAPR